MLSAAHSRKEPFSSLSICRHGGCGYGGFARCGIRKDEQKGSGGVMKACPLFLKSEQSTMVAQGPCEDLGKPHLSQNINKEMDIEGGMS